MSGIASWCNGSTRDFDSRNTGSIPVGADWRFIMLECETCEYYNSDDGYCTALTCDTLDCDEPLPCEKEDSDDDILRL